MAASLNKVFLMGNLTRDPELRYVPSGKAVANFSIAINKQYKDTAGEKKEEVSFVRVVVWGKMAETCGEYLSKGRPVLVEGRLKSSSWETPEGQKRSTLDVVATSVQFLGGPKQGTPQTQGQATQAPATQAPAAQGGQTEQQYIDVDQQTGGEDTPF